MKKMYRIGRGFSYGPVRPDDDVTKGDVIEIRDGKTKILQAKVKVASIDENKYVHGAIIFVGE